MACRGFIGFFGERGKESGSYYLGLRLVGLGFGFLGSGFAQTWAKKVCDLLRPYQGLGC